jgi:phage protein D
MIGRAGPGDEMCKLGSQAGPELTQSAFQRSKEMVRVGPVASQAELDQQAKGLYNESAMKFIQGSGATIGLPGLRAGKIIELKGLGPRFSGLYQVEEATHTISGSGFLTTFTAKRNAV